MKMTSDEDPELKIKKRQKKQMICGLVGWTNEIRGWWLQAEVSY
jgi:hypothetical protein